ncbi:hypothetical protein M422DRAFT_269076 [Sphaerobolus stellatus SS14]|uniref:Uncharacterized protein n=1 Tax=Sphaerobolus stellatus (strain SS14) TaxID=990650 RepID=A0A0C9UWL2_SPHS4|nr:hypothetical protein M422DRAFT_269076 [Sphaerobolus stellatus SS14]
MFVQEKENSIWDIKLDQDAWARHKLFGNDDAPPPQMKGPVTLASADDPAGNEYIKIIQDIVDNAHYWLVKVYDLAFLSAVEAQPLALHLTNNDRTIQYFSGVHEQDQRAAQILSNIYLQWPIHITIRIGYPILGPFTMEQPLGQSGQFYYGLVGFSEVSSPDPDLVLF